MFSSPLLFVAVRHFLTEFLGKRPVTMISISMMLVLIRRKQVPIVYSSTGVIVRVCFCFYFSFFTPLLISRISQGTKLRRAFARLFRLLPASEIFWLVLFLPHTQQQHNYSSRGEESEVRRRLNPELLLGSIIRTVVIINNLFGLLFSERAHRSRATVSRRNWTPRFRVLTRSRLDCVLL